MTGPSLVPSGAAARALGISARTLQRYVKSGLVTPDLVLASGQYRWDVARLREQINGLSGWTVASVRPVPERAPVRRPVASSPGLAVELATRLNEVAPDGFTVEAENTYVTVRHRGEFVGRSGAARFVDSVEGNQSPVGAIERAARVILDTVQDYFVDISTRPWPGERSGADPGVQVSGSVLEMWFGDRSNPVLTLRALDLAP
ncbi:MAG TPA: hypothetical protein VH008_35530 [Pseudonocardia sp.]|nr:hypothetical protein [Pseudonocardia sp.]